MATDIKWVGRHVNRTESRPIWQVIMSGVGVSREDTMPNNAHVLESSKEQ